MAERVIGVDLGLAQDFTAIAVLDRLEVVEPEPVKQERERKRNYYIENKQPVPADCEPPKPIYDLVDLDRPQLGTAYHDVVTGLAVMVREEAKGREARLVVDATGVGRPVVDMLKGVGLRPIPIIITAGHYAHNDGGYWNVPKKELVTTGLALLQSKRLRFAAEMPGVQTLMDELTGFKLKVTTAGNETFEPWREGEHDDLVFALCLACWAFERGIGRPFKHWAVDHPHFRDGC